MKKVEGGMSGKEKTSKREVKEKGDGEKGRERKEKAKRRH